MNLRTELETADEHRWTQHGEAAIATECARPRAQQGEMVESAAEFSRAEFVERCSARGRAHSARFENLVRNARLLMFVVQIGSTRPKPRPHLEGGVGSAAKICIAKMRVRAISPKIWRTVSASSPREARAGRGLRRGAFLRSRSLKGSSSPRPSPPSDGGEGVVAATPRCVHLRPYVVSLLKPTCQRLDLR